MAVPAQRTDSKVRKARHDTGVLWLTQRDIDGLILCGEHYAAPYDLLAAALRTVAALDGIGAQILLDLGIREMILLSNSQRAIIGLEGYGLTIKAYQPVEEYA